MEKNCKKRWVFLLAADLLICILLVSISKHMLFWVLNYIFSFCLSGGWCAFSVFLEDNLYFSACVFQLLRLSPFSYKLKSGLCHFIYLEKENLHLWLP